eukprot:3303154-Rhodomonas_salina.1
MERKRERERDVDGERRGGGGGGRGRGTWTGGELGGWWRERWRGRQQMEAAGGRGGTKIPAPHSQPQPRPPPRIHTQHTTHNTQHTTHNTHTCARASGVGGAAAWALLTREAVKRLGEARRGEARRGVLCCSAHPHTRLIPFELVLECAWLRAVAFTVQRVAVPDMAERTQKS